MKFPFHITLTTLIVSLLILTGGAIGLAAYRNLSAAVEDLSQQILAHVEKRIDHQVNKLLLSAIEQCDLNRRRIEASQGPPDGRALAADLVHVMKQNPWFSTLGYTAQATGNTLYVRREQDGTIHVVVGIWNPKTGNLHTKIFNAAEFPNGPFREEALPGDPRERQSFVQAKLADRQSWLETRKLRDLKGESDSLGLTCVLPVNRNGTLVAVASATFSLNQLCEFLNNINEIDEDTSDNFDFIPFIVEFRSDQSRAVIAHPDPDVVLRSTGQSRAATTPEEATGDPLVNAFLKELRRLYPELSPTALKAKSEAELLKQTRIRFKHDGLGYRGTFRCLSSNQTPDWLICIVVPESAILGRVQQGTRTTYILLAGIAAVAALLSVLVALQVARPLRRLARQTEAIGQFNLTPAPVPVSIVKEVDRLTRGMENMKTSLRSFQKYVPADVVRALMAAGQDASLGGERKVVTIYFSDIVGFTTIAEQLMPEELVTQLAEYFNDQSAQILQTGGTVDKYIGDAIMAFWGAPAPNPEHALSACKAAIGNQESLRNLREKWKLENRPPFECRIGIHTGEVIVGNIGSDARLNYTVIGDAANLASRLEGLNKYYGTNILISEATYQEAKAKVVARPLDWVSVKGKTTGILVYELLGFQGEVSPTLLELVEVYGLALNHYRKQDWAKAIELFEQALRIRPGDLSAQQMMERCREYQASAPPAGWSGVYHMSSK